VSGAPALFVKEEQEYMASLFVRRSASLREEISYPVLCDAIAPMVQAP